ncbi:MerR family transcriptional regulator [Actinomycetospora aeridis]|uniref:MerR family transcriptional regulator n=1 Tax=Actinomycetospora aeridis TaxID=3129231 RepID=A0ABU8ND87_9PSEU
MSVTTERLRGLIETTRGELPSLTVELVRDLEVHEQMSIADVAELTGLSAHTLRYYERIGLVEVPRDAAGRRLYDREAVGRVVFITRLRDSDMPIAAIARYVELVKQGPDTEPERLALLEAHRADILNRLHDLQGALAVVDYKITTYGGACGT